MGRFLFVWASFRIHTGNWDVRLMYLEIVPPKGTSIVRPNCQCVFGMKPKRKENGPPSGLRREQAVRSLRSLWPPELDVEVVVARQCRVHASSVIQHPRKQYAPLSALAGREPRVPLARPVHLNTGTVRNPRTS